MQAFLKPALFLSLLLHGLTASANEDAWLDLQKAAEAARALDYKGTFIYQNGEQIRSVQITHININGQEHTRNLVLDGNAREVFSHGKDIVIFDAHSDKVVIQKRRGQNLFPAMLPTDLSAIKASYDAEFAKPTRVANRAAKVVLLKPNDGLRYPYKIWIDQQYGLLLRMALYNGKQRMVEQIGFTNVHLLQTSDLDWFEPKIDAAKAYVEEKAQPVNHVKTNWVVTHLPPGYKKIDHIEMNVPDKKMPVNQMIYSDGLASVSIFIETLEKGVRPKMGHKTLGSTNICANVVEGYQVVVVGEVPEKTVKQIAKTISFKKHFNQ